MIVFIPIKQNSQRVPGKNFRYFKGKPLWEHTIDKLRRFDVYIDTDSDEVIKSCVDKSWVNAFRRHGDLCGDKVSVVDLIKSFINKFKVEDPICQVHVTSPYLDVSHILDSFEILNKGYDSVFSVTRTQKRFWTSDRIPINHDPKNLIQTQDLDIWYEENSYLYTFRPNVIFDNQNRISETNNYMLEVGFPNNLDIDTEEDWKIIKSL